MVEIKNSSPEISTEEARAFQISLQNKKSELEGLQKQLLASAYEVQEGQLSTYSSIAVAIDSIDWIQAILEADPKSTFFSEKEVQAVEQKLSQLVQEVSLKIAQSMLSPVSTMPQNTTLYPSPISENPANLAADHYNGDTHSIQLGTTAKTQETPANTPGIQSAAQISVSGY